MDEYFQDFDADYEDDMQAEMALEAEKEYKLRRRVAKCDLCGLETVATTEQFEKAGWTIEKGITVCPGHSGQWKLKL